MMYAMTVQQGATSLQLALTGENAFTKQAYNAAYASTAQRLNAADARVAAERNIAAVHQDRILSSTVVRAKQDEAEAQARVNAAVAGVRGQSVDDFIRSTEDNEARKLREVQGAGEQSIEDQLSKVMGAQSALLSVEDQDISVTGEMLKMFSNVSQEDLKAGYEVYQEWSK